MYSLAVTSHNTGDALNMWMYRSNTSQGSLFGRTADPLLISPRLYRRYMPWMTVTYRFCIHNSYLTPKKYWQYVSDIFCDPTMQFVIILYCQYLSTIHTVIYIVIRYWSCEGLFTTMLKVDVPVEQQDKHLCVCVCVLGSCLSCYMHQCFCGVETIYLRSLEYRSVSLQYLSIVLSLLCWCLCLCVLMGTGVCVCVRCSAILMLNAKQQWWGVTSQKQLYTYWIVCAGFLSLEFLWVCKLLLLL